MREGKTGEVSVWSIRGKGGGTIAISRNNVKEKVNV